MVKILEGKCEEVLKDFPDNYFDSIVTDPPYGLRFMGKKWDYNVPSIEQWQEALRVLKPGGYLLSFGGTRTYHRMVVNIEDAGFEIRDQIQWLYGSGFPKSLNISKSIDKIKEAERKIVGVTKGKGGENLNILSRKNGDDSIDAKGCGAYGQGAIQKTIDIPITVPATPEAEQWDGYGTALKPANEPICLARKPLSEKTVAKNVLKWGTGGLNIDGCRVEAEPELAKNWDRLQSKSAEEGRNAMNGGLMAIDLRDRVPTGRFPANVIHDGSDEVVGLFPDTKSGGSGKSNENKKGIWGNANRVGHEEILPNSGSAARFFYCAKASKAERNAGCEGMPTVRKSHMQTQNGTGQRSMKEGFPDTLQQNHHPTVKPIALMSYLCRLITPPNGIILDPFMGSGSTGKACIREGFSFVGIDKDAESVVIAEKRVEYEQSKTHKIWTDLFE